MSAFSSSVRGESQKAMARRIERTRVFMYAA